MRVLHFLKGTAQLSLSFLVNMAGMPAFHGYSDSTWGSEPSSRRSRKGYVFKLHGHLISWQSKLLQPTKALSTCEAEYMALSAAVQESLFLDQLIRHYFLREHVSAGKIALKFCPTKDMHADMLTKPLGITDFLRHRGSLGMIYPSK